MRRWRTVQARAPPRAPARLRRGVWAPPSAPAVVLAALVLPADALADQLFFMHMIQHVLLLNLIPILGIVGLTKVILRPADPLGSRLERRAGALADPAFAVSSTSA